MSFSLERKEDQGKTTYGLADDLIDHLSQLKHRRYEGGIVIALNNETHYDPQELASLIKNRNLEELRNYLNDKEGVLYKPIGEKESIFSEFIVVEPCGDHVLISCSKSDMYKDVHDFLYSTKTIEEELLSTTKVGVGNNFVGLFD